MKYLVKSCSWNANFSGVFIIRPIMYICRHFNIQFVSNFKSFKIAALLYLKVYYSMKWQVIKSTKCDNLKDILSGMRDKCNCLQGKFIYTKLYTNRIVKSYQN